MKQTPCQFESTHLSEDLSDLIQKHDPDWSVMTSLKLIMLTSAWRTALPADDSC